MKNKIIILGCVILTISFNIKAEEKSWTSNSICFYLNQLKPDSYGNEYYVKIIKEAAIRTKAEQPKTLNDFLKTVLNLNVTNIRDARELSYLYYQSNNETVYDVLMWGYTNFYFEAEKMPGEYGKSGWKNVIYVKSDSCKRGIYNIGNPGVINKLNEATQMLIGKSSYTINPNKYPKEAADWLFNSPYPKVRKRMVERWCKSERPEKIEVLRKYIKKLEKTAKMDPYFTRGLYEDEKAYGKKVMINEIKKLVDKREIEYKRWIEDGKRMPLVHGIYYYDDLWEEYKKTTEKEKIKKYGKYFKAKK